MTDGFLGCHFLFWCPRKICMCSSKDSYNFTLLYIKHILNNSVWPLFLIQEKDTSFFVDLNGCHVTFQSDNFTNQFRMANTDLKNNKKLNFCTIEHSVQKKKRVTQKEIFLSVMKILHTNSYIADPLMFSATTTKKQKSLKEKYLHASVCKSTWKLL